MYISELHGGWLRLQQLGFAMYWNLSILDNAEQSIENVSNIQYNTVSKKENIFFSTCNVCCITKTCQDFCFLEHCLFTIIIMDENKCNPHFQKIRTGTSFDRVIKDINYRHKDYCKTCWPFPPD